MRYWVCEAGKRDEHGTLVYSFSELRNALFLFSNKDKPAEVYEVGGSKNLYEYVRKVITKVQVLEDQINDILEQEFHTTYS